MFYFFVDRLDLRDLDRDLRDLDFDLPLPLALRDLDLRGLDLDLRRVRLPPPKISLVAGILLIFLSKFLYSPE